MLIKIAIASVLSMMMLVGKPIHAYAQKDKIEGEWYNEEKTSKILIYKAVDGYFWGKIVWLKEPIRYGKPRVDEFNPDDKLKNRPLINLPVLIRFTKTDDKTYDGGKIYDAKSGKTYKSTITYRSDKELGIRGYIGISLIGRTTTFTRAD